MNSVLSAGFFYFPAKKLENHTNPIILFFKRMEELGDVIHIVQLWVQQRLACSKRRRKKVKRMKRRELAVGS